jgi:hypothetical protein
VPPGTGQALEHQPILSVMLHSLRSVLLGALALASFTACHRAADEALPLTVLGEWRLAVSGGGITGKMDPVPAGTEVREVFGPDSAYTRYVNGQQVEATAFRLVQRHNSAGSNEQLLLIKSTNSPNGQPYYRTEYITLLTPTALHLSTGGGCALNAEYVRVGGAVSGAGH